MKIPFFWILLGALVGLLIARFSPVPKDTMHSYEESNFFPRYWSGRAVEFPSVRDQRDTAFQFRNASL
jgi:hypothetical protein